MHSVSDCPEWKEVLRWKEMNIIPSLSSAGVERCGVVLTNEQGRKAGLQCVELLYFAAGSSPLLQSVAYRPLTPHPFPPRDVTFLFSLAWGSLWSSSSPSSVKCAHRKIQKIWLVMWMCAVSQGHAEHTETPFHMGVKATSAELGPACWCWNRCYLMLSFMPFHCTLRFFRISGGKCNRLLN